MTEPINAMTQNQMLPVGDYALMCAEFGHVSVCNSGDDRELFDVICDALNGSAAFREGAIYGHQRTYYEVVRVARGVYEPPKFFRVKLHEGALVRIDPLRFAWLLAVFGIEVYGHDREGACVQLAVRSERQLQDFMDAANREWGALIFDEVVGS